MNQGPHLSTVVHFDDQLLRGHDSSIQRTRDALRRCPLEVLEAPTFGSLVMHLQSRAPGSGMPPIKGFVIDLQVPQLKGVTSFHELGLGHVKIRSLWGGAQLIEILRSAKYENDRRTVLNGHLVQFEKLPICIVSTNRFAEQVHDKFDIPLDTPKLWKDAPEGALEQGVLDWVHSKVLVKVTAPVHQGSTR